MKISFLDTVMKINGKKVTLPYGVKQALSIGQVLVVRVSTDAVFPLNDRSLNNNVFAFDGNADLLWKIEEAPHGGNPRSKPYTNIHEESGRLIAGNWIGVDYVVNLNNGTVQPIVLNQRPW